MKRTSMHAYINDSDEAAVFYEKAFGVSKGYHVMNNDGTYAHCEFDLGCGVFSISEAEQEDSRGDKMQFCLQYAENEKAQMKSAYKTLCEGADIDYPLEKQDYSPLAASLTDKYGVKWCLYI